MSAAAAKAPPATANEPRPAIEATFKVTASTPQVTATRVIATSTSAAAGMPGTASRLIVRVSGS